MPRICSGRSALESLTAVVKALDNRSRGSMFDTPLPRSLGDFKLRSSVRITFALVHSEFNHSFIGEIVFLNKL